MTTDSLVQSSALLHGSRNQHSPPPPMFNSILSFSNIQRSATPNGKLVEDSGTYEKHFDASSTDQNGFVYVVNVDAVFNKKVGDLSQLAGRNIAACPCHSAPLLLVTREGNTYVRLEERATVKLILILVLLSTALRVLLQTNLTAPVTCHLLVAIVSSFSYLLLLVVQIHKKYMCAPHWQHVANVCFGMTIFEMALAVIVQVWGFARSSSVGS